MKSHALNSLKAGVVNLLMAAAGIIQEVQGGTMDGNDIAVIINGVAASDFEAIKEINLNFGAKAFFNSDTPHYDTTQDR